MTKVVTLNFMVTEEEIGVLKKSQIESAKPAEKKYLLVDGDGLYLAVYPTGKKKWIVRNTKGGKDNQRTIGSYPEMSLLEARNCAARSGDYFGKSFREWYELWLSNRKALEVRAVSLRSIKSRMDINILPFIGDVSANEITDTLIQLKVVNRLEAQGKNATVRKCVGLIGEVLRYAHSRDKNVVDVTPEIYPTLAKRKIEHFATIIKPADIGQLLRDIEVYPSLVTRLALQFVAYTFVRFRNVKEAVWEDFDLSCSLWRIPADKMKCNNVHLVPLSRQVLSILERMKAITGGEGFVFPSARDMRSPMGDDSLLHALRRMGYGAGCMTIHGFRSMATTLLTESSMNWTRDAVELQMAHVESNSVRAAYNYAERMDERIDMMQWYSDYLDELNILSKNTILGFATALFLTSPSIIHILSSNGILFVLLCLSVLIASSCHFLFSVV